MHPKDAKRKILERRAAFVAAAIASVGAVACEGPKVCLSAAPEEPKKPLPEPKDTGVEPEEIGPAACLSEAPMPCLSPPPLPVDAGKAPHDAGKPRPCLKMAPDDPF